MTEGTALAAKLQAEGEKLAGFMTTLREAQWNLEVYADGTIWTLRSVLAHLVTSETASLKLFTQVLHGGAGVSEDFGIDRYNASQQRKTADLAIPELIKRFRFAREQMVVFVSTLTDADLARMGRHPFLGVVALREMVKMIYIHNQAHYRDMRRSLRGE